MVFRRGFLCVLWRFFGLGVLENHYVSLPAKACAFVIIPLESPKRKDDDASVDCAWRVTKLLLCDNCNFALALVSCLSVFPACFPRASALMNYCAWPGVIHSVLGGEGDGGKLL